jgi:hypothetical protein
MLAVRSGGSERFLMGVGAEALQKKGSRTSLPAYPGFPFASNYNVIATFEAQAGAEPVTLALELDPGRSLPVTVVDPDGNPVTGCRAFGTRSMTYWDRRPRDSATFEVTALAPQEPRHLMVIHEGRKLGGAALIKDADHGPLTVGLQPCAIVSGRLVDDDGQPRTGLELVNTGYLDDEADEGVFHRRYPVDRDGRFRLELIPGLSYTAGVQAHRRVVFGKVFAKLTLGPGETKELGDVKVIEKPSN